MFRADLHLHSTVSDGLMSPEALIDLAVANGLAALSITDHDSIGAYIPKLLAYARGKGVGLLPGVELSCTCLSHSVHILGLGVDPLSQSLNQLCREHGQRRSRRNRRLLDALAKHRFVFDAEEWDLATIGRMHLARAMLAKGYISSIQEAFTHYLGDAQCQGFGLQGFSVEETFQVIRAAGGKAILAHPHLIPNRKVLSALLDQGPDGIECYYAGFGEKDSARWVRLAKERGLLISGGSDFHGEEHQTLGSAWVGEEEYASFC